jgi:paraquat-inducible protein B
VKNPAKPATIGAFVVGALLLAVVGVVLFGSGKWFRDTAACVMYFDGDVQGLNVGAPVKFRGVKIGEVTSISTLLDRETLEVRIPVYVDLVDLDEQLYGRAAHGESGNPIKALVDRGLRAQLQSESLVTGQQFVQLDFYPDAPAVTGPLFDEASGRHQIPTLPTVLQKAQTTLRQVLEKLEKLPLEKMLEALQGALVGADKLLSSPDLLRAAQEFTRTLEDIRRVVNQTGEKLEPLIANADSALVGIDRVARELQPLVASAAATVETIDQFAQQDAARLVGEFEQVAREARAALVQTRHTLSSLEQITLPTSATGHQLRETLTELAAAARAVRDLADALEQQPNAVFVGKHREAVE